MNDAGSHLIVGATSEIGRHVARELAQAFGHVILAARDVQELAYVADDVRLRTGAVVTTIAWDATNFDEQESFVEQCFLVDRPLVGVTLCHGFMANQQAASDDFALSKQMIDVNFTSAVSLLNRFAKYFRQRRGGYVCGISSVAGDRGRQSNYIYGATKAAFSTYLAGLRNDLYHHGVAVITVKPGFVDTSMTWGLLNPDSPLVASPARVARDVLRAIRKRKHVVYTPWFWAGIMLVIRLIPEPIFKRLKL